jgi:dipeptidyl aminopeptidase/acylaminoacyl peptidase
LGQEELELGPAVLGGRQPGVLAQSEEFVSLARAAGKDVEFHVFAGEGHGFRQPANQAAEYALVEAFVDRVVP